MSGGLRSLATPAVRWLNRTVLVFTHSRVDLRQTRCGRNHTNLAEGHENERRSKAVRPGPQRSDIRQPARLSIMLLGQVPRARSRRTPHILAVPNCSLFKEFCGYGRHARSRVPIQPWAGAGGQAYQASDGSQGQVKITGPVDTPGIPTRRIIARFRLEIKGIPPWLQEAEHSREREEPVGGQDPGSRRGPPR